MLGAEVKEWVTLTYFRHRENLHAGPGPALLRPTILQRLEGYWDNHATFNLKGSFEMKKE